MEGIILAGGFGTRLRKMVPNLPKPMAPINGKPFLEILLMSLAQKGFTRIVLSLGFMADKIVTHFGDHYAGIELDYVIEDLPLGTGGATRLALEKCKATHAFVFNGDTFLDLEVKELERLWERRQSPIIVARKVPDTSRYGSLLLSDDCIKGFLEKGVSGPGLINAGCYIFPRNQLEGYHEKKSFSLEVDYLPKLITDNGRIYFFESKGVFIDIGVPEDFSLAQTLLAPYLK